MKKGETPTIPILEISLYSLLKTWCHQVFSHQLRIQGFAKTVYVGTASENGCSKTANPRLIPTIVSAKLLRCIAD